MGLILLLFSVIWIAILLPPASCARARRRAEFEGSLTGKPESNRGAQARCRRQILGGLLAAMGSTLFLGALPSFRVLLAVHLLLLNSFLAYITLLVHLTRKRDAEAALAPARRLVAVPPLDSRDADAHAAADEPERQARWNRLLTRRREGSSGDLASGADFGFADLAFGDDDLWGELPAALAR